MKKVKIHCGWDLFFNLELEKQVELFIDFYGWNNRMSDFGNLLPYH